MKRAIVTGSVVCVLLVAMVAAAQTLFLTVTAPPYCEAGGSATVDGVSHLYLTITPMIEIKEPTSMVLVYENGVLLHSGPAVLTRERLIATYMADTRHNYTLVVQESDGNTITAQLLYD